MLQGEDLLKHGRHGKPKMHLFRLVENDTRLTWRSAKGVNRSVLVAAVLEVRPCKQPCSQGLRSHRGLC